jgi:hypothetical protein
MMPLARDYPCKVQGLLWCDVAPSGQSYLAQPPGESFLGGLMVRAGAIAPLQRVGALPAANVLVNITANKCNGQRLYDGSYLAGVQRVFTATWWQLG